MASNSEEAVSNVIKVTGFSRSLSSDLIILEFEKHGPMTVKDLEATDGSLVITFEKTEDAINAVKEPHEMLESMELNVEYLHETSKDALSSAVTKLENVTIECCDDEQPKQSTILVHGEKLEYDYIDLFFSNKVKSGGGEITEDGIKINGSKTKALVTFKDSTDANIVRDHVTFRTSGRVLLVEWPDDKALKNFEEEEVEQTVEVHCSESLNEETLDLLYTNTDKSGGGTIKKIVISSTDDKIGFITFSCYAVAASVVATCSCKVSSKTFRARWPSAVFHVDQPSETEETNGKDRDLSPSSDVVDCTQKNTVEIASLTEIDSNSLQNVFIDNKESEWGPVKDVVHSEDKKSAYITFKNQKDAQAAARRPKIRIGSSSCTASLTRSTDGPPPVKADDKVSEKAVKPKNRPRRKEEVDETNTVSPNRTISITSSTEIDDLEHLKVLFSNRRNGGEITYLKKLSDLKAVITFKEPRDAIKLVTRKNLVHGDVTYSIRWADQFYERNISSITESLLTLVQDKKQKNKSKKMERLRCHGHCTVAVEMTSGALDREVLELLYSNPDNGGDIERIVISNASKSRACITFLSEGDAEKAVKNKTVCLKGTTCTASWMPNRVQINGEKLDKLTLELLYTCKPYTGGGEISNIEVAVNKGAAWITFMLAEDAWQVVEQVECQFNNRVYIATWADQG